MKTLLKKGFNQLDAVFSRVFTPAWNPMYQLGALGFFYFWIVAVTGVYLFIFFETSISGAYSSIEQITVGQWYLGGVMRSFHRYASAAMGVTVTLASLGLGWIGEPAIAHLFEPLFERFLPHDLIETAGTTISVAISFALVTMLHIVLGELVPKSIALQRPEGTAVVVANAASKANRIFMGSLQMKRNLLDPKHDASGQATVTALDPAIHLAFR